MHKHIIFSLFLTGIFFISCTVPSNNKFDGKIGQLLVVCDPNKIDTNQVKNSLSLPLLPSLQPENRLDIFFSDQKTYLKYQSNRRNVLFLTIDSLATTPRLKETKNAVEEPLKMTLTAVDAPTLLAFLNQEKELLIAKYEQIEQKRLKNKLKKLQSVQKNFANFQFTMALESDWKNSSLSSENFVWLYQNKQRSIKQKDAVSKRRKIEHHDILQGLLIHQTPYTDSSAFDPLSNYRAVDELLARLPLETGDQKIYLLYNDPYFFGEHYDPYMEVGAVQQAYAIQLRGIFQAKNTSFGGMLLATRFVHPYTNQLITIVGYVYAPKFGKREYLRQWQARFQTIEFLKSK